MYRFCIRRSRRFKESAELLTLLLLLLAYVRCIKEDWKAHEGNEAQEAQFQFAPEPPVTIFSTQSGSQDLLHDSNNLTDVAVSDKVESFQIIKHKYNRKSYLYEGSEGKAGADIEHLAAVEGVVEFSSIQTLIENSRSERTGSATDEFRIVSLPQKPRDIESNNLNNIDSTQEYIHETQQYPGFDSRLFGRRRPEVLVQSQQAHSVNEQIFQDLEYQKIKMENPKLSPDKIQYIFDTIRRANNRKGFAKKWAQKKQLLNTLVHINDTVVDEISIKDIFARGASQSINDLNEHGKMPECSFPPFGLLGPVPVDQTPVKMRDVETAHPELSLGGRWHPSACRAKNRVSIVIPYRDRLANLTVFLRHIHPILQRQFLHYSIVVVDQADSRPFNRAQLLNIGALEALKMGPVDCFVFHDVDHLPENDHILYNCPAQPLHLSAAVDKFNYSVPYPAMFGGVSALTSGHFIKANGYSNRFWGWGGEDDDMFHRIYSVGLNVTRYSPDVARYTTLRHDRAEQRPTRREFVNSARKQFTRDGLNSLHYRVLGVWRKRLYTRLKVETMDTDRMENVADRFT